MENCHLLAKNKISPLVYIQFRQTSCEIICSHFRVNELNKVKNSKKIMEIYLCPYVCVKYIYISNFYFISSMFANIRRV